MYNNKLSTLKYVKKGIYMKKTIIPIVVTMLISLQSCVVGLNQYGAKVRLVDDKKEYNCKFITTVTGSGSMGVSTAHDAEGSMNEIRNEAARVGGNAVKMVNVNSDIFSSVAVGEALNCEFND